jgi:uncharacterized membrane protein YgaE (UPF0421/DUF939 family)
MKIGKFRIGMRTFKSGLAVMVCVLLSQVFVQINPMIASLSAVFSLRQDLTTSVSFGKGRVIGNTIGGALAIVYLFFMRATGFQLWTQAIIIPVLVIVCITFSVGVNNVTGIITAVSTLLMISFTVTANDSVYVAVQRLFDTFIGTIIAIVFNLYARPNTQEVISEIDEDMKLLEKKEAELRQLRKKIEIKQQNQSKEG